jgi:hypothetical protein
MKAARRCCTLADRRADSKFQSATVSAVTTPLLPLLPARQPRARPALREGVLHLDE